MTDLILQDLRKLFGRDLAQVLCSEKMKMFGERRLQTKGVKKISLYQALRRFNGTIRKIRRKRQLTPKS